MWQITCNHKVITIHSHRSEWLTWASRLGMPPSSGISVACRTSEMQTAGSTHLLLAGITSLSVSDLALSVYWLSLGCKICQAPASTLLWCRGMSLWFWYAVIGCGIQTLLHAGAGDCQLCSFARPCMVWLIMPPLSGVKASLDWKEILVPSCGLPAVLQAGQM